MSQKQKKKSFSPSPEPEVFEDAFDVKAIEGHRNDRGHIKFHVRWDGRDSVTGEDWSLDKHRTWEPPSSFDDGSTVLAGYLTKYPELANHPTLTFIRPLYEEVSRKKIAKRVASGDAKKAGPGRANHPTKSASVEPKKRKESSTASAPPKKKAKTDPGPKKKVIAQSESDDEIPLAKTKKPKPKPSSIDNRENAQKKPASKPKLAASVSKGPFEPRVEKAPTPPPQQLQQEEDDDDEIYEPPPSPEKAGAGAADFELDDAFFHGEDDSGMYMHNDVEMQPQTQEEPEETERHKQLFGAESTSQSEDDVSPEKPAASTSQSVGKGKGKEKQPEVQDILNTSEEEDIAYEKEQKEKKAKKAAGSTRNLRTCTGCRRADCKGRGGIQYCEYEGTDAEASQPKAASQKPASQKRYKPKATSTNSPKKDIFDKTKESAADREYSPDVPMSELAQAPKSTKKKKKQSRKDKAIFGDDEEEEPERSVSPAKAEPKTVLPPEDVSESEKEEDDFNDLFDERKTTIKHGVEQLGLNRIISWATKNTADNAYLQGALVNTRFVKYGHGAKSAEAQILDFWSIPKLFNGQVGLFDAMVKDKRIWIHAPTWVANKCSDRNIQLDVYALQHLLMEKGAEEAGPDARDASVVFIHFTELRTYKGVEAIVKSKRMNKLRKAKEPSFFVWGTQIQGTGARKQELPIFEPIWTLGSALTFTSQVVVSSPQEFLSVIESCGNLTPLFLPWLHVGLVTTEGPLAPPTSLDAPCTNVEASIAVSSANYGTALRVLQPSVPALAPCIGTKSMLTFPAAVDIVDPSSFKNHAHQAIVTLEDTDGNPEVDALMKTSQEMMIRYFGVRRWFVVGTALEHFDFETNPNDPVELIDLSAAQEMISTFLL